MLTKVVLCCLFVGILSQIYQYDPDTSMGKDYRPNSKRVRNSVGAQVGYLAYTPITFQPSSMNTYVLPSFNVSTLTNLFRQVYNVYGIAFKRSNETESSFVMIDSTFIQFIKPGFLVCSFEAVEEGMYVPVFTREDYKNVSACQEDVCFRCNGDNSTCKDCNGTVFGDKYMDFCGVCGGNNRDKDCNGVCFGNNTADPVTGICP